MTTIQRPPITSKTRSASPEKRHVVYDDLNLPNKAKSASPSKRIREFTSCLGQQRNSDISNITAANVIPATLVTSPSKTRSRSVSPAKIPDLSKSLVVVARISSDRKPRSRSPSKKRRPPTQVERENQEKIDRENRILLRKILEQHHGIRRSKTVPPAPVPTHRVRHKAEADFWPEKSRKKATSNQINQQRRKNQTDYENLLLLQKIQNAKPSKTVAKGFTPPAISAAALQQNGLYPVSNEWNSFK